MKKLLLLLGITTLLFTTMLSADYTKNIELTYEDGTVSPDILHVTYKNDSSIVTSEVHYDDQPTLYGIGTLSAIPRIDVATTVSFGFYSSELDQAVSMMIILGRYHGNKWYMYASTGNDDLLTGGTWKYIPSVADRKSSVASGTKPSGKSLKSFVK